MATHNFEQASPRSILVLGAYGLIGTGITHDLRRACHTVIGFGRNVETAQRVHPDIEWRIGDMTDLTTAEAWAAHLTDVSVVVNCAGALQDGRDNDLATLHHHAIDALAKACAAADIHIVQMSATDVSPQANTVFMASKAQGDAAIRASGASYHILRPGLVIAPTAYGGTALLRMLAAVPILQPLAAPNAMMQTVDLADIGNVVCRAVAGDIPPSCEFDLVEPTAHSLQDMVAMIRAWLGFSPARAHLIVPDLLMPVVGKCADALGRLGWRSPLRSTAMTVTASGVSGDPSQAAALGLPPMASLSETLARRPATVEDRVFARMLLLMPMIVAGLSLFWLVSGIIGILRLTDAAETLTTVGWPFWAAALSVVFWGIVDIAIGVGLMIRRFAAKACLAAVVTGLIYLVASTLFVPLLWVDPLGPLVKIVPSILLALVCRVALETR